MFYEKWTKNYTLPCREEFFEPILYIDWQIRFNKSPVIHALVVLEWSVIYTFLLLLHDSRYMYYAKYYFFLANVKVGAEVIHPKGKGKMIDMHKIYPYPTTKLSSTSELTWFCGG